MAKKKVKALKTFKTLINEEEWSFSILTQKEYNRVYKNDDSRATTELSYRQVHLISTDPTLEETLAHECYHAFHVYLHLDSTNNVTVEDAEEIFASFLGKNYSKFYNKVQEIKTGLKIK